MAWSHDTSEDGPSAQFHGDALITEELVVVGSDARPMGQLYAFDRASGELRWKIPFPGGVVAELHRHGDTVLADPHPKLSRALDCVDRQLDSLILEHFPASSKAA